MSPIIDDSTESGQFLFDKLLTLEPYADIISSAKMNISLLRVAEGTGPVKLGNLHLQGAKSCGKTER